MDIPPPGDSIDFDLILGATDPQIARSEIAKFCRIDLGSLDEALSRHAALYAYAAAAFEMSKVQEARAKWHVEVTSSACFSALRSEGLSATAADKEALLNPKVLAAKEDLFTTQHTTSLMRALVGGLEHRRDMLIQISARQRAEMSM